MKAGREDRLEAWLERVESLLGDLLRQPDQAGLVRVLLRYAIEVEATKPSTVEEFVARIQDQTVRSDVMSIAEQLIQKGRQEGEQKGRQEGMAKGALLGRIQFCQEMLGLPVRSLEELEPIALSDLQAQLSDLEGRLRHRLR